MPTITLTQGQGARVDWCSRPFQAMAWWRGKTRFIGNYATAEEAREARRRFLEERE